MEKNKTTNFEEAMLEEIERNERINPNHYYEAKLPAIRAAQEAGINDEDIELAFGIKIMPKDKNKDK